ncbi:MAG: class I SAM-dependent methyltransferase, partial [Planctomycetota bacterium]
FRYVWEQARFNPVDHHILCYIHFKLADGTHLKRAFRYDWRIWSLTELKDALRDAGFARVDVHWEGSDQNGKGNGIFRKVLRAENEECYIAYLAAWVRDP